MKTRNHGLLRWPPKVMSKPSAPFCSTPIVQRDVLLRFAARSLPCSLAVSSSSGWRRRARPILPTVTGGGYLAAEKNGGG